jgi:hypothetical protein
MFILHYRHQRLTIRNQGRCDEPGRSEVMRADTQGNRAEKDEAMDQEQTPSGSNPGNGLARCNRGSPASQKTMIGDVNE